MDFSPESFVLFFYKKYPFSACIFPPKFPSSLTDVSPAPRLLRMSRYLYAVLNYYNTANVEYHHRSFS